MLGRKTRDSSQARTEAEPAALRQMRQLLTCPGVLGQWCSCSGSGEYVRSPRHRREGSARDELRASSFTDGNAALLARPMVNQAARKVLFLDSLMCRREAGGALGSGGVLGMAGVELSAGGRAPLVTAETGADFETGVSERKEEFRIMGLCPGCWLGFRFQEGWAPFGLGRLTGNNLPLSGFGVGPLRDGRGLVKRRRRPFTSTPEF